jgi:hypothetical protein
MIPTPDDERIKKILESSYELFYDESSDVLKYVDENGAEHIAPDLSDGITESSEWLCDKLPLPPFDFDQDGNLRKIDEVRASYTLICIAIIIKSFKDEIFEMFSKYDYKTFSFDGSDVSDESLCDYLNSFMNLNSLRINVIVSAASIQISRTIEKKDVYWKSTLTLEEITEFGRISRDVKNIILNYERDRKLNPSQISTLTRVEKLLTIEKRDLEIESVTPVFAPIAGKLRLQYYL